MWCRPIPAGRRGTSDLVADLLIRVVDRHPAAVPEARRALSLGVGDVVTAQVTGHPWTAAELQNHEWRILRLPNVSVAGCAELLKPQLAVEALTPRVVRKRAARLSMAADAWPPAVRRWFADAERKVPILSNGMSEAALLSCIERYPQRRRFVTMMG